MATVVIEEEVPVVIEVGVMGPQGPPGTLIEVAEDGVIEVTPLRELDFRTGFDVSSPTPRVSQIELDLSEVTAGGELAGTLDAPTVDASHSGSTHQSFTDNLNAHLIDVVDAHDASAIAFTPFDTIVSADVQAAVVEALTDARAYTDDGHVIPSSQKGAASGVASLDSGTKIPDAQIPDAIARDSEFQAADAAHVAAADPHTGYQKESEKSAASGYAALDSTGKVPTSQIPAVAFGNVFVVASQAEMLALAANPGDIAVRSDVSQTFILTALPASTLGNWVELLSGAGGVSSVDGLTGAVTGVELTANKGAASGYAALDGSGFVPDAQINPAIARDSEVSAADAAHVAAGDPHTGYQKESEKGAVSGYPSLDGSGYVPDAQINPTIARDSEVSTAVSTHEAAVDPHPTYETAAEAQALVDTHTADVTDAHDASAVSFVPIGRVASTDVQAAIAEVASESSVGGVVFTTGDPTGTTDSSAALQALIDSVPATGTAGVASQTIWIPEGAFKLNSINILKKAVNFRGMGVGVPVNYTATTGSKTSTFIYNGAAAGYMFNIQDSEWLSFDNILLQGDKTNIPNDLIYFQNAGGTAGTNQQLFLNRCHLGQFPWTTPSTTGSGAYTTAVNAVRFGGTNGNNDQFHFTDVVFSHVGRGLVLDNTQSIWGELDNVLFDNCVTAGLETSSSIQLQNATFNHCGLDFKIHSTAQVAVFGYNSENSTQYAVLDGGGGTLKAFGGHLLASSSLTTNMFDHQLCCNGGGILLDGVFLDQVAQTGRKIKARGLSSAYGGFVTILDAGGYISRADLDIVNGGAGSKPLHVRLSSNGQVYDKNLAVSEALDTSGTDAYITDHTVDTAAAHAASAVAFTPTGTIAASDVQAAIAEVATEAATDSAVIHNAIVDAKGDLIAGTANDAVARLAVGSNYQELTADSATASGLKWKNRPFVDVTDYAGVDPTGATDSTVGIQAAIDATDRVVFFPPGTYLVSGANGLVLSTGGRELHGSGQQVTKLRSSTGDILTVGSGVPTSIGEIVVQDMEVRSLSGGGHCFSGTSVSHSVFQRLYVRQDNNAKSYWNQSATSSSYHDNLWSRCSFQHALAATAPGFNMVSSGSNINSNTWTRLQFLYSGNYVFHFEEQSNNYLYNNAVRDILFEICNGGLVESLSTQGLQLDNLATYDQGTTTKNLIQLDGGAGGTRTTRCAIRGYTRVAGTLGSGLYDINCVSVKTQQTFIEDAHRGSLNNASIQWNSANGTYIGSSTVTMSGTGGRLNIIYTDSGTIRPSALPTASRWTAGVAGSIMYDTTVGKVIADNGATWKALIDEDHTASADPHPGSLVSSFAKSGSTALTGAVTISGGTNVTLTESGQNVLIDANAGTSATFLSTTKWGAD